jgi:hypothetical protein
MKRVLLAIAVLSLAGCAKDINNKDAVKAAILKRVSKTGFDVKAMKVDVTQVSFHDQDAVATVAFLPNGGPPQSSVTFKYNLHRQNDEWVATGLAGSTGTAPGANPHGGAMPGGAMGGGSMGGAMGSMDSLPPSSAPSGNLPAGHPPVGKKQ